MPKPIQVGRKERMTFAKINEVCEMPNLIQIQTGQYDWTHTTGSSKRGFGKSLKTAPRLRTTRTI